MIFQAESAMFTEFQVMCNAESELKQRWSALIIFESEMISLKTCETLTRVIVFDFYRNFPLKVVCFYNQQTDICCGQYEFNGRVIADKIDISHCNRLQ